SSRAQSSSGAAALIRSASIVNRAMNPSLVGPFRSSWSIDSGWVGFQIPEVQAVGSLLESGIPPIWNRSPIRSRGYTSVSSDGPARALRFSGRSGGRAGRRARPVGPPGDVVRGLEVDLFDHEVAEDRDRAAEEPLPADVVRGRPGARGGRLGEADQVLDE